MEIKYLKHFMNSFYHIVYGIDAIAIIYHPVRAITVISVSKS